MNDLETIFKALSDETRPRVIKLLEHGELCVCDITAALDMVQPKVSFHLSTLKEAGFIRRPQTGKMDPLQPERCRPFQKDAHGIGMRKGQWRAYCG